MPRHHTTVDFIAHARSIHGDLYDYSLTNYVNCRTKVIIVCAVHGAFRQKADTHICGRGCPKCGGRMRISHAEFLQRAKALHGDFYDYSQFHYVNCRSKGLIGCPIHGYFEQIAASHIIKGNGCKECATDGLVKSHEKFLADARIVHGDRYDYSRFEYVTARTPGTIICPVHGSFEKTPTDHTSRSRKAGCPRCSREKASIHLSRMRAAMPPPTAWYTTEQYIARAKALHGDRYDYSQTEYVRSYLPVTIICPAHGSFEQVASNHVTTGNGCPRCGWVRIGEKNRAKPHPLRTTVDQFVGSARDRHGDRFDYSLVVYDGTHVPVTIICPDHGLFSVDPYHHLTAVWGGCKSCFIEGKRLSADTFFQRARDQFGARFDYSQSVYLELRSPIGIICRDHGIFVTTPNNHLHAGAGGCPICKTNMQLAARMRHIYPNWQDDLEHEDSREAEE